MWAAQGHAAMKTRGWLGGFELGRTRPQSAEESEPAQLADVGRTAVVRYRVRYSVEAS